MDSRAEAILSTWFGPLDDPSYPQARNDLWWGKDAAQDAELRSRFGGLLARAAAGDLDEWADSARACLALVVLLDQMSRNIHRGTSQMYALDDEAVDLVVRGLEAGLDRELHPLERVFFYMPLMHAENVPLQRKCVRLFEALAGADDVPEELRAGLRGNVDYAVQHRDIVERFGRFPHRNEILGRESTEEEREFLTTPGSSF